MREYLRKMDGNTLVRLDDSVEAVTALGGDRYEAAITSVGFFGLLACKPVATLRVERTDRGIRYVTEKCQMVFTQAAQRILLSIYLRDNGCHRAAPRPRQSRRAALGAQRPFV